MTDNPTQNSNPEPQEEQTTIPPQEEQVSPPQIHLILVSEFSPPQVLTFDSPEAAAETIKEYKRTESKFYAFVFEGKRWMITRGKSKHLVSPETNIRLPLYNDEEASYSDNGLID
jgi:hypothetical protein